MRVRFLETVVVNDHDNQPVEGYTEGEVVDLPVPSAQRWIRRGKAVEHAGAAPVKKKVKAKS